MKVIVLQAVKHLIVGAVATIFDLVLFIFLIVFMNSIVGKGISFLCATLIKYWGNKYWTFQKYERGNWHIEAAKFVAIMLVGLAIDVSVFHYLTNILGPQFAINSALWIKLSVVLSAIIAAIWNFTGDKFLVFKK